MKYILILLCVFFTLFSFSPSLYEIYQAKNLPKDRLFVLDHNYLFDFNFYLSRIRQGQEGRWMVAEKYYNQPHQASLFQIVYLLAGKTGGVIGLSPPAIYHALRLIMGFALLVLIAQVSRKQFFGIWQIIAFLLVVTAGSWPVLQSVCRDAYTKQIDVFCQHKSWSLFWVNGWPRVGTYMGWWSAIDSLQRIAFLPHVLIGQAFILLFVWRFGGDIRSLKLLRLLMWGAGGFIAGTIFPPALIVVYTVFGVETVLEMFLSKSLKSLRSLLDSDWFRQKVMPRIIIALFSFPVFIYLKIMFARLPWSYLPLFDVQHRTPLPYKEYFLALGPVLPLGLIGLCIAVYKREQKLLPFVSWVIGVGMLFMIFERVPQQTPLRFTEAAIHIPLGILSAYLFYSVLRWFQRSAQILGKRIVTVLIPFIITVTILLGAGVMGSMFLWLKDQADAKRVSGWRVPLGVQLAYPLKDFMEGINFLHAHTRREEVVLGYVSSGNFIPAYAGNFVYLGHANTPDENDKEKVAARFFRGEMNMEEAKIFLKKERILYVFFGPQEQELGNIKDISSVYPFLSAVYSNSQVKIYKTAGI